MSTGAQAALPPPTQRVVVLRHGERRDNAPDAPAESDPPLTAAGVASVRMTAAHLKHHLGPDAARTAVLVVSPFLRTVQTAEALQHHGIGTTQAMVVDNTLCEVFGPSRIKTTRAPELRVAPTSQMVGGLPAWGESLETASERYTTNFLRVGDVYGRSFPDEPHLSPITSSTSVSATTLERAQSSLPPSSPPAINRQWNRLPARRVSAAAAVASSGAMVSREEEHNRLIRSSQTPQRVVILVTHGDAISAILSHFYPSRVVYEAEFLSFLILRRYSAASHAYHLEESEGVQWFLEGEDGEPDDPILEAWRKQQQLASADEESRRNESDDGDDAAADVPESHASRRIRSRECRTGLSRPYQLLQSPTAKTEDRVEVVSPVGATRFAVHPAEQAVSQRSTVYESIPVVAPLPSQQQALPHEMPSLSPPLQYQQERQQQQLRHHRTIPIVVDTATQTSPNSPKASEDCLRTRLPTGVPTQSSSSQSNSYHAGHTQGDVEVDSGRLPSKQNVGTATIAASEASKAGEHRRVNGLPHDSDAYTRDSPSGVTEELRSCSSVPPRTAIAVPPLSLATIRVKSKQPRVASSAPPIQDNVSALMAPPQVVGGADASAIEEAGIFREHLHSVHAYHVMEALDERIRRPRAVARAIGVSHAVRASAICLITQEMWYLRAQAGVLCFCLLLILWEVCSAVMLHLSCRPNHSQMRQVREAVESLRFCQPRISSVVSVDGSTTARNARAYLSYRTGQPGRHRRSPTEETSDSCPTEWHSESEYEEVRCSRQPHKCCDAVIDESLGCVGRVGCATLLRLPIVGLLSILIVHLTGVPIARAVTGVRQVYETMVGLFLTLGYVGFCTFRGFWDERILDRELDRVPSLVSSDIVVV